MNKCLGLMILCSGITMYAQNPPEENMFDKNLAIANGLYSCLTRTEQDFCDLAPRRLAIFHVQQLKEQGKENLIPAEIGVHEDYNAIDRATFDTSQKLAGLSKEQWIALGKISAIRISAPFKKQADTVGQEPTWDFFKLHKFEDSEYFDTPFQNESQN